MRGIDKDTQSLVRKARQAGWSVTLTNSNHVRFLSPDGTIPPIIAGGTSGDRRAHANLTARLRRAGLAA